MTGYHCTKELGRLKVSHIANSSVLSSPCIDFEESMHHQNKFTIFLNSIAKKKRIDTFRKLILITTIKKIKSLRPALIYMKIESFSKKKRCRSFELVSNIEMFLISCIRKLHTTVNAP